MRSYADLRARIKEQIQRGRLIVTKEHPTPSDEIHAWIEVSRKCLVHMEDRVPSVVKEFAGLNFKVRIPEHDLVVKGDRLEVVERLDEEYQEVWSQSWFLDGGDHPWDFNFRSLQRAVELLKLADEKLRIDSEPEAAHDLDPTLRAARRSAGNTQEIAVDKSAPPDTALPNGGNVSEGAFDGNVGEAGLEPVSRGDWVDKFLLRCLQETKLKATRKHIWRAVEHSSARQFQYWQASDPKATAQDDKNFRRILALEPTDFQALLKKMEII